MCIGRLPHDNGVFVDSRIPEHGCGVGGRAGTRSYIARAATMVKIYSAGNDHTILLGVVYMAYAC